MSTRLFALVKFKIYEYMTFAASLCNTCTKRNAVLSKAKEIQLTAIRPVADMTYVL